MKVCTRCGAGLAYNVPDMCLTCRYKVERDALAAQLAEVLEYAGHHGNCPGGVWTLGLPKVPCTCGWTAMREKWRGR